MDRNQEYTHTSRHERSLINQESWTHNYEEIRAIDLLGNMETLIAMGQVGNGLAPNLETLKEACGYNAKLIEELI